jgi:hypothetical protein
MGCDVCFRVIGELVIASGCLIIDTHSGGAQTGQIAAKLPNQAGADFFRVPVSALRLTHFLPPKERTADAHGYPR